MVKSPRVISLSARVLLQHAKHQESLFTAHSPARLALPPNEWPAVWKTGVGRENVAAFAAAGVLAGQITETKDFAVAVFCTGAMDRFLAENHCHR